MSDDIDTAAIRAMHPGWELVSALCDKVDELDGRLTRMVERNADNQIRRDEARDEVDRLRYLVAEVKKLPEQWREDSLAADTAEWGQGMESCAYELDQVLGGGV